MQKLMIPTCSISRLNRLLTLLLAVLLALAFSSRMDAASIVKVTYTQDGVLLGTMIYTGKDGGPQSDPAPYWQLTTKAPEITSKVKVKPDEAGGKVATLKGKIEVSLTIRNQFNMGTVKTDTLVLKRKNADSDQWYLSEKELKRLKLLMKKKNGK